MSSRCSPSPNSPDQTTPVAEVTAWLNKASLTLDAAPREKLLNDAEAIMAKQVPSIPLCARPTYVIRANAVNGPVVNPTQEGSPWNVSSWLTRS